MELDNIYNEDCLEGMKRIPDGTIDAVICDLPYGTMKDSWKGLDEYDPTKHSWDSIIPTDQLFLAYGRVLRPGGFNSTREQDLFRLRTLKRLGIYPFVQAFRDYENQRKPSQYEKDIARWANRAWLFKAMDFLDFEPRKGFKCKEYFE